MPAVIGRSRCLRPKLDQAGNFALSDCKEGDSSVDSRSVGDRYVRNGLRFAADEPINSEAPGTIRRILRLESLHQLRPAIAGCRCRVRLATYVSRQSGPKNRNNERDRAHDHSFAYSAAAASSLRCRSAMPFSTLSAVCTPSIGKPSSTRVMATAGCIPTTTV